MNVLTMHTYTHQDLSKNLTITNTIDVVAITASHNLSPTQVQIVITLGKINVPEHPTHMHMFFFQSLMLNLLNLPIYV